MRANNNNRMMIFVRGKGARQIHIIMQSKWNGWMDGWMDELGKDVRCEETMRRCGRETANTRRDVDMI